MAIHRIPFLAHVDGASGTPREGGGCGEGEMRKKHTRQTAQEYESNGAGDEKAAQQRNNHQTDAKKVHYHRSGVDVAERADTEREWEKNKNTTASTRSRGTSPHLV